MTDSERLLRVVEQIALALRGLDDVNCDRTSETVYDELRALPVDSWRRTVERFCCTDDVNPEGGGHWRSERMTTQLEHVRRECARRPGWRSG